MLKVTKPSPNRLEIVLEGSLDSDTMRTALDELIRLSEDIERGKMLYRISDFQMPTLGALGVELTRLPKLFGLLGKFNRCAMLSDASWIRKTAEIEGALFPGLDIKAFPPEAEEEAEAWLNGA